MQILTCFWGMKYKSEYVSILKYNIKTKSEIAEMLKQSNNIK